MRISQRLSSWGKPIMLLVAALVVTKAVLSIFLPGQETSKIRNVLIISLDTTRADYLGCYGCDKSTTPHIDAIAADGVLFEQAVTPVALTFPAHVSALTGTQPPFHHVHDNHSLPLPASNITLAEVLSERGFATGAVVSCYVLRKEVQLNQGFTVYDDQFDEAGGTGTHLERKGGEVTRHVNEYLTSHRDVPFCLLAHYYDPHHQYTPPEPFASRFPDDPYAGEIAYMDHCVGQVVQQLKDLGLYESTLIVVMGDHGEGLGEHGELEHGYFLYQNTNHVPLIIRSPGAAGGRRVEDVVSLIDVMPTILGYLDLPIPAHVQGRDLSDPASHFDPDSSRYVYTEAMTPILYGCNPLLALVGEGWKYIDSTRPELYNLNEDPAERVNLYSSQSQRAATMQAELASRVQQLYRPQTPDAQASLDADSIRQLKSLGYLGGENLEVSFAVDPDKPDAKDLVSYHNGYQRVFELLDEGQSEAAYLLCQKLLKDFPGVSKTHFILGDTSFHLGDWQRCMDHLQTFLQQAEEAGQTFEENFLNPDKTLFMAKKRIAQSCRELGNYEQSARHYRELVSYNLEQDSVHSEFAAILMILEDYAGAVQQFQKSLEFITVDSKIADTLDQLAGAFYALGDLDASEKHVRMALQANPGSQHLRKRVEDLEKIKLAAVGVTQLLEAVRRDPNDADAHDRLAGTFFLQKKLPLAIKHWTEIIRIQPDNYVIMNNVAWILSSARNDDLRDPDRGLELAERAAKLSNFQRAGVLDTLALSYAAVGNFAKAEETAAKALELAVAEGKKRLAAAIEARLKLYQNKQTYRE